MILDVRLPADVSHVYMNLIMLIQELAFVVSIEPVFDTADPRSRRSPHQQYLWSIYDSGGIKRL